MRHRRHCALRYLCLWKEFPAATKTGKIVADRMRQLRLADRQHLEYREEQGTGQADTVTKAYMRGNAVFADAFNYLLYDGRAVIDPHNLKEIDPTEIALPFGVRDGKENRKQKEETVQKYRDLLKNAVIMEDGKTRTCCWESRTRPISTTRCQ